MSRADADRFVDELRDKYSTFALNDVVVFVDYRENNSRKTVSLIEALQSERVARHRGTMVRAHLKAGDVVLCRVVARRDESDAEQAVRAIIDENIHIETMPASTLLADYGAATQFVALWAYERKTVSDLVNSLSPSSGAALEEHFDEQINRLLAFCQTSGARQVLIVEGFVRDSLTNELRGSFNHDSLHSLTRRLAVEDGFEIMPTGGTRDSARSLWKDARIAVELSITPSGWIRYGTGENRLHTRLSINKSAVATPQAWYRATLVAIRGVTDEYADAVIARYPTMPALVAALARVTTGERDRVKLLANITLASTTTRSGSTRRRMRLGPVAAKLIVDRAGAGAGADAPAQESDDDDDVDDEEPVQVYKRARASRK